MTFESLLNNNIYLRSKVSSQNDLGEWTYTYTTTTNPIKCRIRPIRARETLERPGLYDNVSLICYCLSSANISRGDQISYNNEFYKVREVLDDSSYHHKKALLELIT